MGPGQRPGSGPFSGKGSSTDKAKDFKNTLKKLGKRLHRYSLQIIIVTVFAVASTIFVIAGPKILGQATNQIIDDYITIKAYEEITSQLPEGMMLPTGTKGIELIDKMPEEIISKISSDELTLIKNLDLSIKPTYDTDKIASIIGLLIILYLLSMLFNYIQTWVMSGVTQKVTYKMRKDISHKINRLPLSYYDKNTNGEILSRITNDIDTVSQTLNQSISQIITSIVMVFGIIYMMLTISWVLTIVMLIVLPLSFIFARLIMKQSQKQFVNQQNELGQLNSHIEEMYSGHTIMTVFNGKKRSLEKFNEVNDRLFKSAWKSQFLSGVMMPIMTFVGNLGYVGVAVVGGWLAINGKIKIGDIQAFIQYVQQFNQPIAQSASIMNIIQSTVAAAERVFEFLDEKNESSDLKKLQKIPNISGSIEFKNVIFGYEPNEPIIKGLSIVIQPGQRVAIVGPTGAGKTTLVNLLMRFYEIDSGSIIIDGVDIKKMKRADVRRMFGMVLQNTWLFNGTIRDNLKYGNENSSDEDMELAAKHSYVDHFIKLLPDGYDTEIDGDSDSMSQGEKQLLTIARAMIANAPMLILDEATSSVDTRTELLIQNAMDNLMKNKTSFVIAHRLSTIKNADLILVVNDGNIVEQGNHNELMNKNGQYTELYNSQFEHEEEE